MSEQEAGLLTALFVDDDPEIIEQCRELLPNELSGHRVDWTFRDSFEDAQQLLTERRFDVLVTDVYKGRKLSGRSGLSEADNFARHLVASVKQSGFTLVILYSDGPQPEGLTDSPSIRFVDKAGAHPAFPAPISDVLSALVDSRGQMLSIIEKIRKEFDRSAGSYIWTFIDTHWDLLSKVSGFSESGLERLIRRRAAIQINERLESDELQRRPKADRYDYYLYPPLPGALRLGTVLRETKSNRYYLVLTPHCHLAQNGVGQDGKPLPPRAERILIAECIAAKDVIAPISKPDKPGSLRIPANAGKPDGRLCFLPGFATIPDLYVDLMRLSSVATGEVMSDSYERVAVLDSPFAEAVQASLSRFYANVGHRNLDESDFEPLFQAPAVAAAAAT